MKMQTLTLALIAGALCQFNAATCRAEAAGAAPPNTRQVIEQKIHSEVAARLAEAGATCDDLQVAVAVERDSATPYKVTYRGLRNFRGQDGATPEANGEFVMKYIGGGQWRGALAGTQITARVGARDNINLPFVDDPRVLGEWTSVDFVADVSGFDPARPAWQHGLYLKGLTFLKDGKMPQPWWTWTKGFLLHHGDQTASQYEIKEINGTPFLFLEWKSGDVTIAGMKPHYYVLKPKAAQAAAQ